MGALFVTGLTLMIVGTIFVGLEINLTSSADGAFGLTGRNAFSALGKLGLFLIGGKAGGCTSGVYVGLCGCSSLCSYLASPV